MRNSSKLVIITLVLLLGCLLVVLGSLPDKNLHIISCDVGQGDASLLVKNTTEILIDGGPPNGKVAECLSNHLPFWDRKIELIIITHPESDHFGGLIEVFERYDVETLIVSGVDNSTQEYEVLKSTIGGSGTNILSASDTPRVRIGLIYLDIIHPTDNYISQNTTHEGASNNVLGAYTTKKNLNDFSVVTVVTYGKFKALYTGDITPEVIPEILTTHKIEDVDLIKIPHHGSKNGLTEDLLKEVTPEEAFISVGKNQWGHPHQEVLDILSNENVSIHRTDQEGDLEIVTDGLSFELK